MLQSSHHAPKSYLERMIRKLGDKYINLWDSVIRILLGALCTYSGIYYCSLSLNFTSLQLKHFIILASLLLFFIDIPRTAIFTRKQSRLMANLLKNIKERKPVANISAQELWNEATSFPLKISRNLFGTYLTIIVPCEVMFLVYEKMPIINGVKFFIGAILAITSGQLFYYFSWEVVLRPVLRLILATGDKINIGAAKAYNINLARKMKLGFISIICISLLLAGTLGYYKLKEAIVAVSQGINPQLIIASFTVQSVAIALVTLLLVVLLSFLFSRSVSNPIQLLNEGIEKITHGNLDTQIEIISNDELGHLAQVFNEMIVKLKESNDFIKKQNVKLKELDRLKSEFLANTSHELRTPINGIIGLVESILDGADGKVNKKVQHHLTMVRECGGNLKNLVDNLLDLTKVMVGQAELKTKRFNLKSLLNLILPLGKGLVRDKNLKLTTEIAEGLPDVYADQDKIWQVIINLLGNAVKFTEEGEIKIGARLSESKEEGEGKRVLVYVSDTGIGIKPEDQQLVFEEFRQVNGAADREHGGTGLGLSITKKILEKHNCSIWLESAPGEGSTFYFTLPTDSTQIDVNGEVVQIKSKPVKEGNEENVIPKLEMETNVQSEIFDLKKEEKYERIEQGQGEVILVVDDNPVNIEVVKTRLELNNYRVIVHTDSLEALDVAQKDGSECIDLIILDLMMPKMSGYEFCQRLRKFSPDVPIIMLTAKGSTEDLIYGLNLGANDYIAKPFNKEELVARVSALLRMRRLQNRLKQANMDLTALNENLEQKVKDRTKALEFANNKLKQIDQKKTEFLSVVSHDLRTPLTSIKAFTEILMDEKGIVNKSARKHLEIINTESDRLTRLINDLLNLSRLQLGKEEFHLKKLDIAQTARKVIDSISPLLKKKDLKIREKIPGNLPPIDCDPDKLTQVLYNILGNAIKFSHSHSNIQIDVQTRRNNKNGQVEFCIADEGIGIAKENFEKIFLKFKKAEKPIEGYPSGTGLGLAICKEIIRQLGGHIWVESTLGKGSTFHFTLPVRPNRPRSMSETTHS